MRVLIVKISALGDVIHALPTLAWLKSIDPSIEIDWLVEEGFAPLLEGHSLLRKVHRLGLKRWRRQGFLATLKGIRQTIIDLRQENYDMVLDLQGNCKSGIFTLLAGASQRFGFARDGVREWPNLLATNRKVALTPADHHVSDRSLAVARAAFPEGKTALLAGPMNVSPEASATVQRQLTELDLDRQPLVVLQYGTTWTTKLWPLECWQELAGRLCDDYRVRPILLWGNDTEKQACIAIHRATDGRAIIWPRGSLPELVALLQKADLVIGGDTGPIHIAAAVGTSTISLFRVTDAERNGPRGDEHICLQSPLDCSPCLRKDCERDAECGKSISVSEVFRSVCVLLRGDK
ncbi:lipopolysaccharide heptosyltransferase I [Syntrophotalea acetylenivorans]|uniref:Lipopolysaccharide heptosyltransferase 1 n=1 Tax=Syntrophotalea acetylenivorans TaxID=1842532 RepID=A0A1L3GL39_9BACT|nr:lipopolysaccharide heptosyltransferase I [Syntrophotalea acetylenivorans]APG26632.1 lipopolysaccharide heptosyltransferase I [Syntrophotalea acetylenivorans]